MSTVGISARPRGGAMGSQRRGGAGAGPRMDPGAASAGDRSKVSLGPGDSFLKEQTF